MNFYLYRDIIKPGVTLGELTNDGKHFSWTCEDEDRKLEDGGVKVYGQTAIPRGRYRLGITFSPHFKRDVVEILSVPGFTKVYFHGGNTPEDSLGCILHGKVRDIDGPSYISNCAERVKALVDIVEKAEDFGEEVWLSVK